MVSFNFPVVYLRGCLHQGFYFHLLYAWNSLFSNWFFWGHFQVDGIVWKSQKKLTETTIYGVPTMCLLLYFLKVFICLFLEGGREGEREGNINVWLSLERPLLETQATTQPCTLTGNQTGDPLVRSPVLNPLSHTSQGCACCFIFNLSFNLPSKSDR